MTLLYTDTADLQSIQTVSQNKMIKGFTTNPTLMRQAGITDYCSFANQCIEILAKTRPDTSLSLEVFADDAKTITEQAVEIDRWGKKNNYCVYVKIPVSYTNGTPTYSLIEDLVNNHQIKVNVTAVFTKQQIANVIARLNSEVPAIISIFCGRIADVGDDPEPICKFAAEQRNMFVPGARWKILWASSREPFNLIQARRSMCDIITMTPQLISKVGQFGKSLDQFSLETVNMFYNDAKASQYTIQPAE